MQRLIPVTRLLFMRIAEPRHIRLLQFGIYLCMIFAGLGVLTEPSIKFESVVGPTLVYLFGGFLILGSVLGAIAVLPGIWWLERVGIISLATGLSMYVVMIIDIGSSPTGIAFILAFMFTFVQRWTEIKGSQLAPREE